MSETEESLEEGGEQLQKGPPTIEEWWNDEQPEKECWAIGSDKFTCGYCFKQLRSKRTLELHCKRHLQIKEFICEVCHVAKVSKSELVQHMRIHDTTGEKFPCPICPMTFSQKYAIARHIKVVHEKVKNYACRFCTKTFATQNSVECHERLHTGARPFKCEICSKGFIQADGLKYHMLSHDDSLRAHVCAFCHQRFKNKKIRIFHERRHMGDKPHICVHCGKGRATPEELMDHLKLAHDDHDDYDGQIIFMGIANLLNFTQSLENMEDYEYEEEEIY